MAMNADNIINKMKLKQYRYKKGDTEVLISGEEIINGFFINDLLQEMINEIKTNAEINVALTPLNSSLKADPVTFNVVGGINTKGGIS